MRSTCVGACAGHFVEDELVESAGGFRIAAEAKRISTNQVDGHAVAIQDYRRDRLGNNRYLADVVVNENQVAHERSRVLARGVKPGVRLEGALTSIRLRDAVLIHLKVVHAIEALGDESRKSRTVISASRKAVHCSAEHMDLDSLAILCPRRDALHDDVRRVLAGMNFQHIVHWFASVLGITGL